MKGTGVAVKIDRALKLHVSSSAVERTTGVGAELAGGNVAAWEKRVLPLVAFLGTGGKTLAEVKKWARSEGHFILVMEEALYWLLAQNRVVREFGVWRLVRK